MRSFEPLEHTADAGIRARATTLAELLVACAEGMFALIVEGGQVRDATAIEIAVEADGLPDLVHAWLRELLWRFNGEGMVFARYQVHEASETAARATCLGEPFDPERHTGGVEIKAVTYHGLKVERRDGEWLAEVLFDI